MRVVRTYKSNIIINKSIAEEYIEKKEKFNILKEEIDALEKAIKEDVKNELIASDKKCVVSNGITASLVSGSSRVTIDSARLMTERPDVYKEYSKVNVVDSYITLKIKG